jgi:hypothetical protein
MSSPLVVDGAAEKLAGLISSMDWDGVAFRYELQLAQRAAALVEPVGDVKTGAPAAAYLEGFIAAISDQITASHDAYGSVRWLWYLRRLPTSVFAGYYNTTSAYDRALAESLSWFSKGQDKSETAPLISFKIDESATRHVCRYVAGAKLLSHLHILYRRVGKGASLDPSEVIPFADTPDRIDEAIRVYDERHDVSREPSLAGLGLANVANDTKVLSHFLYNAIRELFLVFPCSGIAVPVAGPTPQGEIRPIWVNAKYALQSISAEALLNPFDFRNADALSFLIAAEPLILLLMMFPAFAARIPWALSSTLQTGYFMCSDEVLVSLVQAYLPELHTHLTKLNPSVPWSTSYQKWRVRIDALVPEIWPLRAGGVFRSFGQGTLVDISAASSALIGRLVSDRRASDLANDRAATFELQVQALIDLSPWKPPRDVAAVRGKTLRAAGQAITDVDAIGVSGDRLLLVSCKSLIYEGDYDRGTHRVVRNAEQTLNDALKFWRTFIERLRREPVGENFDFSGFQTVIGVVCTPFVVYSSNPETWKIIEEGLRACVSAQELVKWLQKPLAI